MRKLTTEEFIEQAKKVHGDKYDYSKVNYVNAHTLVHIICPIHGDFLQTPNAHLSGRNCFYCNGTPKLTREEFIDKARQIHGNKYDYSKVNYKNNDTKICIICPEHGEFFMKPSNHVNLKQGCPECGKIERAKKHQKNTLLFINEAKQIHGDRYDYSKVKYESATKKVCIICSEHGEFWQTPSSHLSGSGCPVCGKKKSNLTKSLTTEKFIEKAKQIHGDRYDYSKVNYLGYDVPVEIICKTHGSFYQTPDSHLQGKNCAKCSNNLSRCEEELFNFCYSIDNTTKQRVRNVINPYELDIYIEDVKVAIEYNGHLWHSEKYKQDPLYHIKKMELCNSLGIKLFQIFEDEYVNNKEIVLEKIRHLIGQDNSKEKIMGRLCVVKEINNTEAKYFLKKYHIQGFVSSTIYLGCFYNEKLIAVMSFKKYNNEWELNRFASDYNYICQGVGGKMFKYFIRNYSPNTVKSFADRRWTQNENNLYTKLGFIMEKYIPPDYKYYKPNTKIERIHKFNFRKQILHKKYGFPLTMTEREMTKELGLLRIYDCGLIKYVWKKEN